jgi:hypothetical protein
MSSFSRVIQVMLFRQFHRPHELGDARTAIPIGAMAGLLVAGLGIAGCAGTPDRPPAVREPAVSPSADVTVDQAWHDAKAVAARGPGRMPAVGTGSSMQPVFGEDTLLVVNPIAYDDLRPGMTVAYRNRRGVRVVHRLVVKLADGWRIMGLNNDRVDDAVVTRENLIGVIYASFNYDTDEPPKAPDQKAAPPAGGAPPSP